MATTTDDSTSLTEVKDALILMPFQSGDAKGEKESHLKQIRIKHIVENLIKIKSRTYPGTDIKYKANIVNTGVGDIEAIVEKQFEQTDLFIALLSQSNVNVIFEVAILNVLQQNLVLLEDGEIGVNNIPVYLNGYGRINFYAGDGGQEIKREIDHMAGKANYKIRGNDTDSKSQEARFLEKVEEIDHELIDTLEDSIQKYEHAEVAPPLSFRKLVRDIHPSHALSTWNTLIPMCILRAKWRPTKKGTSRYDGPESLIEEPYAINCNYTFTRILGQAIERPEDFIEAYHPLTGSKQMEMFQPLISGANYDAFIQDQTKVFEQLFIQDLPTKAKVPLEFKNGISEHPNAEFRGKVFLPVLFAKKVVGVRSSPHATYYVISYIEDFFPFEQVEPKNKHQPPETT